MKFIEETHLKNKKIVLRCDLNVPIKDGIITDDSKIVRSVKTIQYLLEKECQIFILSHLGRVKTEEDKIKNTLKPVRERLSQLLNLEVTFVTDCNAENLMENITPDNKVVLLENTRWTDVPEKKESANDLELAKKWASLGDAFVFDAFGSAHRSHSSTAGIAHFLPTYMGYLVKEELDNLSKIVFKPVQPFVVIMGGAKVDDKIPLIKALLPKCDALLLGGGIANSFLKASGKEVGKSLATEDEQILGELKYLIELYQDKLIMPNDVVVLNDDICFNRTNNLVLENESILDIGTRTIKKYNSVIEQANTIFMNGTLGLCEDERFKKGTQAIFEKLINIPVIVIGGGDTVSAVNSFNLGDKFILSSGGGASLEFIAKGKLDALEEIERFGNEKNSM